MRSGARLIAAGAACLAVPAVLSQSKRYAGVTLNVSCWSAAYPVALSNYIAEFEALSGAKVNYDTPGFQIYNQRADLELSTKGAGFDVLNITFVFTNRWIGNGWFAPLEPFLSDPNKTPADYDFADFLTGAVSPLRDSKGAGFGVPWVTDSAMAIATRYDLLQANGLQMPDTFDELEKAAATLHKKDGVDGFLADNHWGFWYPPFLQGYGGNVFRAPPDDLMPTLATPEAIHAAEQLSRIVGKYSTAGAAGMSYGQTQELLRSGKANLSRSRMSAAPTTPRRSPRSHAPCALASIHVDQKGASRVSLRMAGASLPARATRTRPGPSSAGPRPRPCLPSWSRSATWVR